MEAEIQQRISPFSLQYLGWAFGFAVQGVDWGVSLKEKSGKEPWKPKEQHWEGTGRTGMAPAASRSDRELRIVGMCWRQSGKSQYFIQNRPWVEL